MTQLLTQLHWLKVPERVEFNLVVTACSTPSNVADEFHEQSSDVDVRRRLCSALLRHHRLLSDAPAFQQSATEAFPVAALQPWNTVLQNVTSPPSLIAFRKRWKVHLFNCSFPPYSLAPQGPNCSACAQWSSSLRMLGLYKSFFLLTYLSDVRMCARVLSSMCIYLMLQVYLRVQFKRLCIQGHKCCFYLSNSYAFSVSLFPSITGLLFHSCQANDTRLSHWSTELWLKWHFPFQFNNGFACPRVCV